MQEAARNLTPVTLELGGKSPCILDQDADLEVAIRRITWGKFFNAGQTCVAPDYLFIPKGMQGVVVEKIRKNIESFYTSTPRLSGEFTRIVSDKHFKRLEKLLSNGKVVVGGDVQLDGRYFPPTVIVQPDLDSPLMTEEIFGPILPILEYENIEQVIDFIKERDSPLALYYFGKRETIQRRIVSGLSFGGACINDTLLHLSNPYLPFGGVGASGMGSYHGYHSFKAFSHCKSVLHRATWFDLRLRYPPYATKIKWLKWLFR
jgi:aldehyde dehydrogenase (NAD+)